MLLNALREYGQSLPVEPAMYRSQPVRYVVELGPTGAYHGLVDTATGVTGRGARGTAWIVPAVARTSADKANLLVDNAEYALGVAREGSSPARAQRRHQLFLELVRQCAVQTREAPVGAVLAFLEEAAANPFDAGDGFDAGANVAFRVDGAFPTELRTVQRFWARASGAGDADGGEETAEGSAMACLVCGEVRPVLRRVPFKVKNVPGGQVSGTALISANANAFESYGLEESLIAPVCFSCAESFSRGLNALIAGEATHLRRDPLLYVFWTRGGHSFSPLSFLERADPEEVKELLRAARTARTGALGIESEQFYALSLAGSGGRVAIRDWMEATVGEVRDNLARFFRLQRIVDTFNPEEPTPLSVRRLLNGTMRDPKRDEPPPSVERALYRVALAGGPAPPGALFAVVRRLRAEQKVTRERAALVKLVLLSKRGAAHEEEYMVGLDRTEQRPAYLCGRLLAVVEQAQESALGNVNATVVDRFYGSASSTPVAVFPRLMSGAQHHLSRLRRDKGGLYRGLQREIQGITAGLPGGEGRPSFPSALSLEDQGWFALGYYHQRAERFTRRGADAATDAGQPGETGDAS